MLWQQNLSSGSVFATSLVIQPKQKASFFASDSWLLSFEICELSSMKVIRNTSWVLKSGRTYQQLTQTTNRDFSILRSRKIVQIVKEGMQKELSTRDQLLSDQFPQDKVFKY